MGNERILDKERDELFAERMNKGTCPEKDLKHTVRSYIQYTRTGNGYRYDMAQTFVVGA